jgi:hypothetical protein
MDRPSGPWHISPAADAAAYHFSWLFILIPLLSRGASFPADYLFLFCLVAAANVAHQALTFPLVLADRELFQREKRLFIAAPILVLACTAVVLALSVLNFRAFLAVMGASALISTAWNFWHVYMQKYGILRLYNAKSSAPIKIPAWSDKLFVFAWLPLYFAVLGPRHREALPKLFPLMRSTLVPLTAALSSASVFLVPIAIVVVIASLAAFLHCERRSGLSWPRLSFALGMTGLSASILLVDPIKAVLAFGFSHLVEYFVFVWAYERKRGLPRPGVSMLIFVLASTGAFLFAVGWGRLYFAGARFPVVLGIPFDRAGTVFVVYQSLFHFHVDGKIWKVSRPEVRRAL